MKKLLFSWLSNAVCSALIIVLAFKAGWTGLLCGAGIVVFSIVSYALNLSYQMEKEKNKTNQRELLQDICVSCGKNLPAEGSHICWDCQKEIKK